MIQSSMKAVKDELRQNYEVIQILERNTDFTPGCLCKDKRGNAIYYKRKYREEGVQQIKYLGKASSQATKDFVGSRFRQALLQLLEENNTAIERFLREYKPVTMETVYGMLSPNYAEIGIEPFLDKRLEELKTWAAKKYPRNPRPMPDYASVTRDGTKVRSKGECIWYNELLYAGIPFRYECAVKVLDDNGEEQIIYPDFLILCYDGSFILIEHLGLMKKVGYSNTKANQARWLHNIGFDFGTNLFITSDNSHGATNTESIRDTLLLVEKRFWEGR